MCRGTVGLWCGCPALDQDPAILDADLVVAADGINSRFRETFSDQFQPRIDLRPNLFSWMGSTRPFDAFTFFFRETEHVPAMHAQSQRNVAVREAVARDIAREA